MSKQVDCHKKKWFASWVTDIASDLNNSITKHKVWFVLLSFLFMIILPLLVTNTYYQGIFVKMMMYALIASSLNIINGYSGQFNIGHVGFYCVGAYTYALLNYYFGLNFWLVLPFAGITASIIGLLVSLPTLRLKGMYLAMVTLGASEIIRLIVVSYREVTGGGTGLTGIDVPILFGWRLGSTRAFYYIILLFLVLMLFLSDRILRSRIGRAWISIREDQNAAAFMGVEVAKYKAINFMYGAFWAGIAGAFSVSYYQYANPSIFTATYGNEFLSIVILGGQGTLVGPLLGSVVLIFLTEILRFSNEWRYVLYSVLIILMMWFRPQGLLGAKHSIFASRVRLPGRQKMER